MNFLRFGLVIALLFVGIVSCGSAADSEETGGMAPPDGTIGSAQPNGDPEDDIDSGELWGVPLPNDISEIPFFDQLGFIGRGYNPYKGNPHAAYIDPGFKAPLFDVGKYTQGRTTSNKAFRVPDGVDAIESKSCTTEFETRTITDTSSFEKSISAGIDIDVNVIGAPFSANFDYKKVEKQLQNEDSVFMESSASCEIYQGSLQKFNLPPKTANFRNALESLPASYTDDTQRDYMDFFRAFGTHVATTVAMGARITVRQELSKSSFSILLGHGLNVEAAASAVAAGDSISGNGKVLTNLKKEHVENFKSNRRSEVVFTTGTRIPPNLEKYSEWLTDCEDDVAPVRYSLLPISAFVGDAQRHEVDKAIKDFCKIVDGANCDKVEDSQEIYPLCPEPAYTDWKSNHACIIDSFDDDKKVVCQEGHVMSSFRITRNRLLSSIGVNSAHFAGGCIESGDLKAGTPRWVGSRTKGETMSFACEKNNIVTGINFGHYCFRNTPFDEFVSLQCSRSGVLGQCHQTEWTAMVPQAPAWTHATCSLGTVMTGIEFKYENSKNELSKQMMRLTCCETPSKCNTVLPSQ